MADKSIENPLYERLVAYYSHNKSKIRNYYKLLTKKFLDYNDPINSNTFLREPQFEALEMYVFIKEYLNNKDLSSVYSDLLSKEGKFKDRDAFDRRGQALLINDEDVTVYKEVVKQLSELRQFYPNYIFALTMGVGKTLLMATCIFYEFLLANKFPKDKHYCHNALIFAPDKTVLQSLREIEIFDKTKVVPKEYAAWLDANLKFHFLDDSGITLNTLDGDDFNLIISNTQKIILKKKNKEENISQLFFKQDFGSLLESDPTIAELYNLADLADDVSLTSNQRFKKLSRLPQIGIYVDEAHHVFGKKLIKDMHDRSKNTSLRVTIDALAKELEKQGTHIVACYNYTGTPYVSNQLLPEVVYAYTLRNAIDKEYLKQVHVTGLLHAKSKESVELAIKEFLQKHEDKRYENMIPKIAFFAATIKELQEELRPAVEAALSKLGIPIDRVLVNVGDERYTSNDDIREFNLLDTPASKKQFILLVNKGKEGWNCRSLFAVCMFRKPKSTIFVLQATMRCLRSITNIQQTAHVYLSDENEKILEKELENNFQMSLGDLNNSGNKKKVSVLVRPKEPSPTVTVKYYKKMYTLSEKNPEKIELGLQGIDYSKYHVYRTDKNILKLSQKLQPDRDITSIKEKRDFSYITLVAEIARYLNKPCLEIKKLLTIIDIDVSELVSQVSKYNDILFDYIIPRIFQELYEIEEYTKEEIKEVKLVNPPKDGEGYLFRVLPELLAKEDDPTYSSLKEKSFHLDHYCFDSTPELQYFISSMNHREVDKVWFTGMLTHGQSEFMISYIDPESHTLRNYFPDFLIKKTDGNYVIIEVKGDNKLDDPVVLAKKEYAKALALLNNMKYEVVAGSEALHGITKL